MAKTILVLGESGSGKTTSLRNLPPDNTYYIDADGKGLSWKGWRKSYSAERKNYARVYKANEVSAYMSNVASKAAHIKYIVVDTLNSIMTGFEFDNKDSKGYDKWMDLAYSVYDIIRSASGLRDDLTIIFTAHIQTDRDETTGQTYTRMLTNGKKLDKVRLESFFTTVFMAERDEDGEYILRTHTSGRDTVKTPLGAFDEDKIENDMALALKALEDY